MNISHVSTAHPTKDIRIFHKECVEAAKEHSVSLFVRGGEELCNGVRIFALRHFKSRLARMLISPWLAFLRLLKSDVVHFHDPELLPVGLALKIVGKVVIYDAHEDLPRQILHKTYIPWRLRVLAAKVFGWLEEFVAARIDAVVSATPSIAERFGNVNNRAISVSNYPRTNEVTPSPWATKRDEICYLGSVSESRGIFEALSAANISGVRFILAGPISASLKARCTQHPGWRLTDYRGVVDRTVVAGILASSKIGLSCLHPTPAYLTAQATKIYEYMAAGIPVIASNFPLWREFIESTGCGICVDPLDPAEIASAIRHLLSHNDDARRMGERGRMAIVQRYNWEAEAGKLLSLYRELAAASAQGSKSRQHPG